ncbi:M1 family metallopeptidase [Pseudaquabacterium pictum]|uniref:Aminopeptidase n=1 Tax=Pseudaquabacterium pictum TaxID=2315236 RepID=A0A480AJS1_9BURK|nr:M1 family metallopeptidase [Rubrivivax pictus]GCL61884.1 aminopeptidase [Rubrivivax pictus]
MPLFATPAPKPARALHRLCLLWLAGLLGVSALPPTWGARPAPAATVPMRLPTSVVPQDYQLHLQVDPDQPRHQGEVAIRLQLQQPVPARGAIRLHARGLQLREVWLETGARRWRGKATPVDAERVDLHFGQPLPAGPALLTIAFSGTVAEHDVFGLFRQQEAGHWAVFTQFQADGARRAFPLFDEPGWKVPWTLSLTVPQALVAVANMPVASEEAARPGHKRVTFQPTPPMPSYLLAFGVGRFDVRDAGTAGRDAGVPMRFIVPTGRAADADLAAGITSRILAALEAWFDMPHPYAKLDSLALPLTTTFGAMEHAGLVTYASTLLLASPAERTPQFEREYVSVAAHELAHQWFGNLVTLAWWDDLWLNESFASWLGDKITDQVQPAWGWHTSVQRARAAAMRADRLATARRIEQPVLQDEDMGNLWDAITYEKGQTVLAMFEAWLGPEAFQTGVRRYIGRHAWGSATSADFFNALGEADPALPAAVRSFTRQGGIPRLAVTLLCSDGPPRLQLAQSRLLPLGSPSLSAQRWQLPLQVRTPAGSTRLLMTEAEATLPLPDADCPAWVQANAGGAGYWRAAYAGDGLARLAAAPGLSVGEWLALLDDATGLHASGDVDSRQALALVRAAAVHPSGEVVQAAMALLRHLEPLAAPGEQAALAAVWQAAFGARARALGWQHLPTDSDDDRLLRAALLPAVAVRGDDAGLRQQALQLARAWQADRASLPADLRVPVLTAAAHATGPGGGPVLFQQLLGVLQSSTVRTERGDLLTALGQFRQPGLPAQARAVLLQPQIDLRDSLWPLLRAQAADPAQRGEVLAFVLREQAGLAARLGGEELPRLPGLFNGACSSDEARRIEAGFAPAMARVPGGRGALARTLEAVRLCTAWRARQASGLSD